MLSIIWSIFILTSIIYGFFSGNYGETANSVIEGGNSAIKLLLTLGASISVWSGIMNIADNCGITNYISILFSPILKFLFPEYKNDKKVMQAVSTNLTANLIGIGNAATPAGLKAIAEMNKGKNKTTNGMTTFIVMNTSSIQIIPTTIIALRISAGSNTPTDIIPCIWISSTTALIVGILATKVFSKIKR